MCCCHLVSSNKKGTPGGICLRRNGSNASKVGADDKTEATTSKSVAKSSLQKAPWKHILIKVKSRKRLENGKMGNSVQAINILSGEKCALMVDPQLIDD